MAANYFDAEEDELAPFRPVLAVVRKNEIPLEAKKIWNSAYPDRSLLHLPIVRQPHHGSYNILFEVQFTFKDKREEIWLLKIPINGIPSYWDTLCTNELESEARTMQLIRNRTTIPVPEVFGYEKTCDNPLKCPHIWLSFIPGISLYDFWHAETSEANRTSRRTHVLKGVASAMVQLSKFSYNEGGRLLFDSKGQVKQVVHRRERDSVESDARLDKDNYMPAYRSSGPYGKAKQFYTTALDRYNPGTDFLRGQKRLLEFFIDCVDEFFADYRQSFVLAHPDFSLQNFLVDKYGNLTGIIDWDGVGAWPKSLGNLSYPGWLTRDWDPGMYGCDPAGQLLYHEVPEDSPQTLVHCRYIYQTAIVDAIVENNMQKNYRNQNTSATLITENLYIAATHPMRSGNILKKIVDEIAKVAEVPYPYSMEFLYRDLCYGFAEGKLPNEVLAPVKGGFTALLRSTDL
ncbi:hypothetical protein B0T26DRAFT_728949 [Lasiosphaeria miniovina]|uniref:Aminoglycoside phosphotransferase domain-containing protein n=1 Tax=Lasiosphaeria miniovina TaxID=1954250 RepID=A0AA40A0I8_9PEZI|nr:uncharacterized protein B0T26DRAFT_728949 [Lasiosphaeria miniovina]KAK0707048.1 hypothetical protein B0T26DRAFT_728949 [Lasiosphaeria miniovina]